MTVSTDESTTLLALLALLASTKPLTGDFRCRRKSAAPEIESHGAANPRRACRQLGSAKILPHSCTIKQHLDSMRPIVGLVTAGWGAESGFRGIAPESTRQSGVRKDCGARSFWPASRLHTGMPLPQISPIQAMRGCLRLPSPLGISKERNIFRSLAKTRGLA